MFKDKKRRLTYYDTIEKRSKIKLIDYDELELITLKELEFYLKKYDIEWFQSYGIEKYLNKLLEKIINKNDILKIIKIIENYKFIDDYMQVVTKKERGFLTLKESFIKEFNFKLEIINLIESIDID